jgi:hypothetical protein
VNQKNNGNNNKGSTTGHAQDSRQVKDAYSESNRDSPSGVNQSKILQTTATPVRPTGNPDE